MLFPFFSLYITERFSVGLIEVGFLFGIFSLGGIFGGVIGGAMTDKFGRKVMMLFGLVMSGSGSIVMGLVDSLNAFLITALFLGFLGDLGGPARQAMIADLLPPEKQADGFGLIRVAVNLSATIGPALGGFLLFFSGDNYMILFVSDAISSFVTAIIVFFVIPESMPEKNEEEKGETLGQTVMGYFEVLKDWIYVAFIVISMLATLVYMQMYSTLSVFLLDNLFFTKFTFGLLLAMNALMVVVFQFLVTRIVSKYAPMKMIMLGTLLYAIGFGMYGFISSIPMAFLAMIIITIGEMVTMPISQSIASRFAPPDKRGRYMAVFGFSWSVPMLFGVIFSGWIYEYIGPNWLWYIMAMIAMIAVICYGLLHKTAKHRFSTDNQAPETDQISDADPQ